MNFPRRSKYSILFASLLAVLLSIGKAAAEPSDFGPDGPRRASASIFGIVVSNGAFVADALVTEESTGESARTDFRGRFVLSGISAGSTKLTIATAAGLATVSLTAAGESRLLAVVSIGSGVEGSLAANLLKLVGRGRTGNEIQGAITSINGSTLAVHDKMLSVVNVRTTAKTVVRHGVSTLGLASLAVKMNIQAKASLQRDGTFLADEIDVEDDNGDENGGASGVVKSFDCNLGTMVLTTDGGDVSVTFDSSTEFESKDDESASCADLAVGDDAEVEGALQGDGSIAASKISFEAPEIEEVEVQGTVKSVSAPSFVVTTESGDVTVTTDSNSLFEKCGDPAA